jgi:small subunit ribosomal protein S20
LANIKSAKKRAKQSEAHRQRNASQRSAMRTQVKSLEKIIASGDQKAANEVFRKTASVLDKAARKGLIHKNTAARKKSRLNKRIKSLASKKSA